MILKADGMEYECKPEKYGCNSKCCKDLIVFVNIDDVNRWINEDKIEILAALTWHFVEGRNPPYMLFIPKKMHIANHSFFKVFFRPEWAENTECIFLKDDKCTIYDTRPDGCRRFPKGKVDYPCPGINRLSVTTADMSQEKTLSLERKRQNKVIFKEREMLSMVIKKAKDRTTISEIGKRIFGLNSKAVTCSSEEKKST